MHTLVHRRSTPALKQSRIHAHDREVGLRVQSAQKSNSPPTLHTASTEGEMKGNLLQLGEQLVHIEALHGVTLLEQLAGHCDDGVLQAGEPVACVLKRTGGHLVSTNDNKGDQYRHISTTSNETDPPLIIEQAVPDSLLLQKGSPSLRLRVYRHPPGQHKEQHT